MARAEAGAAAGVLAAALRGRRRAWPALRRLGAALLRLLGHRRRKAAAGAIFGSAAPWIRARQSHAPSEVNAPGRRHVSPLPCQHAWRGIGIWPRQGNRRG